MTNVASFLLNMRRYSNGEDDSFWLEAWNGAHIRSSGKKGSCRVDHLLVGITGGLQPDVLSSAFDGDHNGMLCLLLFRLAEGAEYRPYLTKSPRSSRQSSTHDGLIDLPSEGEFAHRTIPFSWDARKRFEEFAATLMMRKKESIVEL